MLGCIHPMSSPMMKRMLGFCCCCALAVVMAANDARRPRKSFLVELMACFLSSGCPNWAGSRRPVTVTPKVRRDVTVIASSSPSMRLMDGGFVQIVRASSLRTAESTHVSCTEDAMVEQSQVREGLCEITSRYRSFVSNHAPHVCKMRRYRRDAAK